MNIRKLTSELARRERTKSKAKIQAISSIVGHLSDIFADEYLDKEDTYMCIVENGARRAKRSRNENTRSD